MEPRPFGLGVLCAQLCFVDWSGCVSLRAHARTHTQQQRVLLHLPRLQSVRHVFSKQAMRRLL